MNVREVDSVTNLLVVNATQRVIVAKIVKCNEKSVKHLFLLDCNGKLIGSAFRNCLCFLIQAVGSEGRAHEAAVMVPASTAVDVNRGQSRRRSAPSRAASIKNARRHGDQGRRELLASSLVSMVAFFHDNDLVSGGDAIVEASYRGKTPKKNFFRVRNRVLRVWRFSRKYF